MTDTFSADRRPLRDDVDEALERHLSFYQDHAPLVMIANRSFIAHDPAFRIPIADGMRLLCDRMLDASGAMGHASRTRFGGPCRLDRPSSLRWPSNSYDGNVFRVPK